MPYPNISPQFPSSSSSSSKNEKPQESHPVSTDSKSIHKTVLEPNFSHSVNSDYIPKFRNQSNNSTSFSVLLSDSSSNTQPKSFNELEITLDPQETIGRVTNSIDTSIHASTVSKMSCYSSNTSNDSSKPYHPPRSSLQLLDNDLSSLNKIYTGEDHLKKKQYFSTGVETSNNKMHHLNQYNPNRPFISTPPLPSSQFTLKNDAAITPPSPVGNSHQYFNGDNINVSDEDAISGSYSVSAQLPANPANLNNSSVTSSSSISSCSIFKHGSLEGLELSSSKKDPYSTLRCITSINDLDKDSESTTDSTDNGTVDEQNRSQLSDITSFSSFSSSDSIQKPKLNISSVIALPPTPSGPPINSCDLISSDIQYSPIYKFNITKHAFPPGSRSGHRQSDLFAGSITSLPSNIIPSSTYFSKNSDPNNYDSHSMSTEKSLTHISKPLRDYSLLTYIDLSSSVFLPSSSSSVTELISSTGRLPRWLKKCMALQYLIAPGMGITVLEEWISQSLKQLKVLRLNDNLIKTWPDHLATLLPFNLLQVVNLEGNPCFVNLCERCPTFASDYFKCIEVETEASCKLIDSALNTSKQSFPISHSTSTIQSTNIEPFINSGSGQIVEAIARKRVSHYSSPTPLSQISTSSTDMNSTLSSSSITSLASSTSSKSINSKLVKRQSSSTFLFRKNKKHTSYLESQVEPSTLTIKNLANTKTPIYNSNPGSTTPQVPDIVSRSENAIDAKLAESTIGLAKNRTNLSVNETGADHLNDLNDIDFDNNTTFSQNLSLGSYTPSIISGSSPLIAADYFDDSDDEALTSLQPVIHNIMHKEKSSFTLSRESTTVSTAPSMSCGSIPPDYGSSGLNFNSTFFDLSDDCLKEVVYSSENSTLIGKYYNNEPRFSLNYRDYKTISPIDAEKSKVILNLLRDIWEMSRKVILLPDKEISEKAQSVIEATEKAIRAKSISYLESVAGKKAIEELFQSEAITSGSTDISSVTESEEDHEKKGEQTDNNLTKTETNISFDKKSKTNPIFSRIMSISKSKTKSNSKVNDSKKSGNLRPGLDSELLKDEKSKNSDLASLLLSTKDKIDAPNENEISCLLAYTIDEEILFVKRMKEFMTVSKFF